MPEATSPVTPEGSPHSEESLAFALADGRVGLLSVRGRRIQDLRPCPPHHLALEEGGVVGQGVGRVLGVGGGSTQGELEFMPD